jgi:hypothetical protein
MATQQPNSGVQKKEEAWSDFIPKTVGTEDALSAREVEAVWLKMYKLADMPTAGEQEKKALRCAVYTYCCLNGTSREGGYGAEMILSNGRIVGADIIPKAAGRLHIRKFLRGNMDESYSFLKNSRVIEKEERYVAKCATMGIDASCAFATADWLGNCPHFTPTEQRAHEASFSRGLERSRRARGGTLEETEASRVDDLMRAQGPMNPQSVRGERIDF